MPVRPQTAEFLFLFSGKYPYGEVLAQSLLFYEAERYGPLPSDNRCEQNQESLICEISMLIEDENIH